jgi:hypothetical protein
MILASIVHILPLTTIRRERVLPVPGRVLVRQGQKVQPHDIIAEAVLAPEHLLLNVSRSLGVSAKDARSLIQREIGEQVVEGDLIAGPVGITRKVLRAPVSGRIALIRAGKVLFEVEKNPDPLRARMPGIVSDLVADRGAIIETTGALIQGIWGNGRMDAGLLQINLKTPDSILSSSQLDVSLRGTVVLGGYCDDPETLHNAANIPLKGLILTSMSASLVPLARRMPIPIILLRGFGLRPLDSASFRLLTTNINREVVVNAVVLDRHSGIRPEIYIPLSGQDVPSYPPEIEVYEVGKKVRLTNSVSVHSIGTIEKITDTPVLLKSGLRAVSAHVKFENQKSMIMPLANLEILT